MGAYLEHVVVCVLEAAGTVHLAILDGAGVHGGRAPEYPPKANVNDRPRSKSTRSNRPTG